MPKKRKPSLADIRAVQRHLAKHGGEARAKNLTAEQRTEIARKAAQARWKKAKKAR